MEDFTVYLSNHIYQKLIIILTFILTVTEETSILYVEIKLHNPSNEIVTTPSDPNDPGPQPIRFTNKDSLNAAEIEMRAKFVTSGTPPKPEDDHYITEFKYGIVYGEMKFEYIKSKIFLNKTQ